MEIDEGLKIALGRMADRLVQLGYADSIIRDDAQGKILVRFTGRGNALQADMLRIIRGLDLTTDEGFDELQAFFIVFTTEAGQ